MAFNGSGTYVLPGAALADGQTISATEHNTLRNDMATALTTCVTRDGQSPATANLPMGGFKLTGLAAGTGNGESIRYEQLNGSGGAAFVGNSPSGNIAATTVQAAINELDTEKAALAGATFTGAINEAYATVASHTTTAPIWAASGNVINYTGTAVATDFPAAPQAGSRRFLICASTAGFNNTATISTPNSVNIVVSAGDVVEVIALTTTTFKIRTFASVANGTFTPTLVSSGGGAPTYTHQIGYYTLSGGRVHYSLRITLATLGTLAAGNLTIAGLPITSNNTTSFSQTQTIFITAAAAGLSAPIMATIIANSTSIIPYKFAAGSVTQLADTDIGATTVFQLQGSYAI